MSSACLIPEQDYYDILEVPRDATSDRIRRSYRDQARRYHPNNLHQSVCPDRAMRDANQEHFKIVQNAYQKLYNESERDDYDEQLRNQHMHRFLRWKGWDGSTTSTNADIVDFLWQRGFPAHMQELGLPTEGVRLSLDGYVWFYVAPEPDFCSVSEDTADIDEPTTDADAIFEEDPHAGWDSHADSGFETPDTEAESDSGDADVAKGPSETVAPKVPGPEKGAKIEDTPEAESSTPSDRGGWWTAIIKLVCLILCISSLMGWCHSHLVELSPQSTYYDILGVPVSATTAQIKQAYHRAVRRNRPDKAAWQAQGITMKLNEACKVLSTADRCDHDYVQVQTTWGTPMSYPRKYLDTRAVRQPREIEKWEAEQRAFWGPTDISGDDSRDGFASYPR